MIELSFLGRVNVVQQLDSGYQLTIARHNKKVRQNRAILSKIIDCIKFCGKSKLPLREYDESTDLSNPGVLR